MPLTAENTSSGSHATSRPAVNATGQARSAGVDRQASWLAPQASAAWNSAPSALVARTGSSPQGQSASNNAQSGLEKPVSRSPGL